LTAWSTDGSLVTTQLLRTPHPAWSAGRPRQTATLAGRGSLAGGGDPAGSGGWTPCRPCRRTPAGLPRSSRGGGPRGRPGTAAGR
jgi:hypothetical protein